MSEIEKKVLKAIKKTGLPTEIKTTKMLGEFKYSVFNQHPYLDKNKNKIRTLDIVAKRHIKKIDVLTGSWLELFIECKKSAKQSWVFYTEPEPISLTLMSFMRQLYDFDYEYNDKLVNPQNKKSNKQKTSDTIDILNRIPTRFKNIESKIALSQENVFNDRDAFRDAQMKLLNAIWHRDEEFKENWSRYKLTLIPIILFSGHIFECHYENGELITPEIEYTRYLAHSLPHQRCPILIDVMTLDYFPKYLKLIEKEFFHHQKKPR